MTCYHPIRGYRAHAPGPSGKRPIVFTPSQGYSDLPVKVPCGQCIGCRLERSRQWAVRCVHEAQLHEANSFITLTYDDHNLPDNRSIDLSQWQRFMKRLRKHFCATRRVNPETGRMRTYYDKSKAVRFFACGEYGELCSQCGLSRPVCKCKDWLPKLGRPHYHAILFNLDFADKELFQVRKGVRLYTSETLQKLWPFGFSSVGDVTFESAAYVARYVMKKITGPAAAEYYEFIDPSTGEVHDRQPEWVVMSRRPGIAADWLKQFQGDVYPSDFLTLRGQKMRPPRFYDRVLEEKEPEAMRKIRLGRIGKAAIHKADNTPERLRVKEAVRLSRSSKLVRNLS